ncbi:MAG TPA: hypothetical protein VEK15_23980 [Vicinamibacteria bacterium]|nr:hypothetical protein [Vicinamibacteria bacterium]
MKENLEPKPSLTDSQAERLWRQLEEERRAGSTILFENVEDAVTHLSGGEAAGRKTSSSRAKRRSRHTP